MKIVNTKGCPELIYKFMCQDNYDFIPNPKSLSATGLLRSIRETILTNRHNSEITVEAIDRLWALFGSGIHAVLEQGKLSNQQEERINVVFEGYNISGKFDLINNGELVDFKTTSAYTMVYGDRKEEWIKQLSIYRWLYWKKYDKELSKTGKIIAIFRDWSEFKAKGEKYPKAPIVEIPLELMPFSGVEMFIKGILDELSKSEPLPDAQLPTCSLGETWNGKKCAKYCSVNKFCNQFKGE